MAEACLRDFGRAAADTADTADTATTGAIVARLAVRSLYQELALYPKPGLVSLVDTGSHDDMDASTFVRSLFSLRRYFLDIALAGADGSDFAVLRGLGIDAERRMLAATGGINTHRGAIFSLGMLCAAAGRSVSSGAAGWQPDQLRATLVGCWGAALAGHRGAAASNGAMVRARHAAPGAREQAAAGFPAIFELALPTLRRTLALGRGLRCARIDTLFTLMAELSDTNVYHRGGADGARIVRDSSLRFLERGGTAADLLAATCFVHALSLESSLP
jgi:triphosphoribosyl-dephospho-CoA synthase